jgi:hypothetical protein
VLHPLHEYLMKGLRQVPMDGTHDQAGVLDRVRHLKRDHYGSYDLSSATDLIPSKVSEVVLEAILPGFGSTWRRLVTDRDFSTPRGCEKPLVRYGRGQPMGCLTSFPMLALTHHCLIQYAVRQVEFYRGEVESVQGVFRDYAVVGDDMVMASNNQATLDYYLAISKQMSAPISILKSFESEVGFNFISRTVDAQQEISPISLKAEISIRTSAERIAFLVKASERGWFGKEGEVKLPTYLFGYLNPLDRKKVARALTSGVAP